MMVNAACALRSQGKVSYIQPYIHGVQPCILIIQDKWMLDVCKRLLCNNGWPIDSTFKTNQFGLPLYAVVAPNK